MASHLQISAYYTSLILTLILILMFLPTPTNAVHPHHENDSVMRATPDLQNVLLNVLLGLLPDVRRPMLRTLKRVDLIQIMGAGIQGLSRQQLEDSVMGMLDVLENESRPHPPDIEPRSRSPSRKHLHTGDARVDSLSRPRELRGKRLYSPKRHNTYIDKAGRPQQDRPHVNSRRPHEQTQNQSAPRQHSRSHSHAAQAVPDLRMSSRVSRPRHKEKPDRREELRQPPALEQPTEIPLAPGYGSFQRVTAEDLATTASPSHTPGPHATEEVREDRTSSVESISENVATQGQRNDPICIDVNEFTESARDGVSPNATRGLGEEQRLQLAMNRSRSVERLVFLKSKEPAEDEQLVSAYGKDNTPAASLLDRASSGEENQDVRTKPGRIPLIKSETVDTPQKLRVKDWRSNASTSFYNITPTKSKRATSEGYNQSEIDWRPSPKHQKLRRDDDADMSSDMETSPTTPPVSNLSKTSHPDSID
jgi:hypothetical protein